MIPKHVEIEHYLMKHGVKCDEAHDIGLRFAGHKTPAECLEWWKHRNHHFEHKVLGRKYV